MKKFISVVLTTLMLVGCFGVSALADTLINEANVYVTIAVKGELVMTQERVFVTDTDGDGTITINDALYCAHESSYDGGAEAGFASAETEYGLSIVRLWDDASGNFGYYLNNASAWSVADTIKAGDDVYAFVYTDSETFSDAYSYFNLDSVSAKGGEAITLTLSMAGYDENWNPVELPVAGATITVDGVATDAVTDENGNAAVVIDESGEYIISAVSETATLVPPVCTANITPAETSEPSDPASTPDAGDSSSDINLAIVAVFAFAGVILAKKKAYAK